MNNHQYFIYLLIMAGSTYIIRALPFAAVSGKIHNRFIRSFLTYIPYAVLTVMTIPAIFYTTEHIISGLIGLIVAILVALKSKSLTLVAFFACLSVYMCELFF